MTWTIEEKRQYDRERYAVNRLSRIAQVQAYHERHPERYLWRAARHRALKLGVPFTVTEADIVIPATCPVLGIPLKSGNRHTAPSLDRHKPALGYVPGNITVMSNRANILKSDATTDEILSLAVYLMARDAL
jgi:hypothetical protein